LGHGRYRHDRKLSERNLLYDRGGVRRLGLVIAIVVAVVDILYLWYIRFKQGGPPSDLPLRVPFIAAYLALLGICAALSTVVVRRWRVALLGACAGGLLLLGFFGLFSIGLPLVVAGLLAIVSLTRSINENVGRRVAVATATAGGLVAVVLLIGGFEVTERIIDCPPGVVSGGGGSGFLTGAYSYTCQNGRAVITNGP
jgi:hypothetical protein